MVRGQEDLESLVEEGVEQRGQHAPARPLADLVVHPGASELHAVHDPIHHVDHQPRHADPGARHELDDRLQVRRLAQVLRVDHPCRVQSLVSPEPLPRRRFAAGRVDAGGEVPRQPPREAGLARDRGQRGDPGEQAVLAKPQPRTLLREHRADRHPLVEGETVHHDERNLAAGRLLHAPRQGPGNVVNHHRRRGRQIVQRLEAPANPLGEPLVNLVADALVQRPCFVAGDVPVGVEDQRVHLRPPGREGQPVVVPRPVAGQRGLDRIQQPVEPAPAVRPRVDRHAGPRPTTRRPRVRADAASAATRPPESRNAPSRKRLST